MHLTRVTVASCAALGVAALMWAVRPRPRDDEKAEEKDSCLRPPDAPMAKYFELSDHDVSTTVASAIKTFDNFPTTGTTYIYAMDLFNSAGLRHLVMGRLRDYFVTRSLHVDCVVALEARGMVVGAYLATVLGIDFMPMRRVESMPASAGDTTVAPTTIDAGYRSNQTIAPLDGVVAIKDRTFVIVDDVISSGSTAKAIVDLIVSRGGTVCAVACIYSVTRRPVLLDKHIEFIALNRWSSTMAAAEPSPSVESLAGTLPVPS